MSIAAPIGQRDENLPLRGRDGLLAELAEPRRGAGAGAARAGRVR